MLKTELLISTDDWENRVAVLEAGALAEIYFEREEKVIGSIFKGRVENVLPGMGACFVNIGLGRNAFLYVDDIRRDPINIGDEEMTERRRGHTVGELLKVGDEVLVQIVKEPRGLKGARVSTNVSLPGRYLVLMPTGKYSGVSSRIEDDKERERLKHIMRRLRPEGMATIVRTAAAGVSEAELLADLGVQVRLWHTILESYRRATAPALLHKDLNLVFKAVRDFLTSDVEQVVIDSKEQYEEIRSTMSLFGPQYLNKLKLWQGPGNLFQVRGIDDELQKLLKPKIFLPSGGHLVIESTEALTVVDVNTGKFTGGRNLEDTIVRTNIEAAAEIARQVRLRDIGGIIVVDFIDMAHERSREAVIATLSEALRRDRTRSTIQMFSNLGLLEFTRKRVGKDLAGQLRSECPYCGGLGDVMSSETLAIGLLRQIRQAGIDQGGGKNWDIVTDPSVATQLMGWYREEFDKLAKSLNADLRLFVEPQRHREQALLEPAHRQRKLVAVGKELEADLLPVRLPDPASGVAVVDNLLIEVKDAASGVGQTVKLRIVAADPNVLRAELAEPLTTGRRRRRRRGKMAAEAEALIKPLPPAQPARVERVMPREVFGLNEEEEEDYTLRGRPAGNLRGVSTASARPAGGDDVRRGRGETRRGREDSRRGGRGRSRRGRGLAEERGFKPVVVGGESDIDYDDGDESSVVVVPDRTKQVASIEPEHESAGEATEGHRRKRRRGRGGRKPSGVAASEPAADLEDDREEVSARERDGEGFAQRTERRPEGERRPRRFTGPIRQLYGAPVDFQADSERERPERTERTQRASKPERREPERRPAQRGERDAYRDTDARPARRRRDEYADDELEAIVKPARPARVDIEFVPPGAARPRRDEEFDGRIDRGRGRGDRGRDEGASRESRRGGVGRGRPRGGRGSGPGRSGPAMKQVYPPPGQAETLEEAATEPESGAKKRPPMRGGRPTHGALFGAADAAPPPKGKVRQLYPPPPDEELVSEGAEPTQRYEPSEDIETVSGYDEPSEAPFENQTPFETVVSHDSIFISDEQELEERRRLARERAEQRLRDEPAGLLDLDEGDE